MSNVQTLHERLRSMGQTADAPEYDTRLCECGNTFLSKGPSDLKCALCR